MEKSRNPVYRSQEIVLTKLVARNLLHILQQIVNGKLNYLIPVKQQMLSLKGLL